ncbi:MAG: glucose-6-phosphate dehydrogenase [Verrucomicrobia bacterium]|nr:glucose-6-phosphate dehydrogenase [Verrucomicrobiota bacterium]
MPIDEDPLAEQSQGVRFYDPCIVVVFGATGDLTARKIMPALYNLTRQAQLPSQFACVGFARRPKTHDQFREEMKQAVGSYSRVKPIEASIWDHFSNQIFYHQSEFHEDEGYQKLKTFLAELDAKLGTKGNRIFYLSTQPSFFPLICQKLKNAGLLYDIESEKNRWSRVIIEKPFGHDLESAKALQKELLHFLDERQIYRIDHYLGKETVQNLLVFRFANTIFESLWNKEHIDHVQITVAEDIGIGTRGKFWEEAGIVRDILQNHMMQLLTLVAMEPPKNMEADSVRDEKVRVLKAIQTIDTDNAVRGQYGPGYIEGEDVIGYREEQNVSPTSSVETYAAMKLLINNKRWKGVPFYLRCGKRLPKRATEIAVTFKEPACTLFPGGSNVLAIRIQPDEGTALKINTKVPGPGTPIQPVRMDFRYGSYFGMSPPEAYERLICDCIVGDSTLFAREDEVFASWKLLTPLLHLWQKTPAEDFPNYASGSWGPHSADQLIEADGRKWRLL